MGRLPVSTEVPTTDEKSLYALSNGEPGAFDVLSKWFVPGSLVLRLPSCDDRPAVGLGPWFVCRCLAKFHRRVNSSEHTSQ